MTESEFKNMQQLVRKIKNWNANRAFFRTYIFESREIGQQEFEEIKTRYEKAKSIRREIVSAKEHVKKYNRLYDTVGVMKKDWAEKILKDKIAHLNIIKKEFVEF